MAAPRFASVDDYLASLDAVKATTLRRVLDVVVAAAPDLAVTIAWNTPQVRRLDGKYVFGVNATKNYLLLAPWSGAVLREFTPRLTAGPVNKFTFQVPSDWIVDETLLRDLVSARLAELA